MRPAARRGKDLPKTVVSAERVWAAAVYAHRENAGEYHKEEQWMMNATPPYRAHEANKTLMWRAIMDISLLTEADFEFARTVRDWTRKDLLIKTLKGALSEFDQALSQAAELDEFVLESDRYEIALITSRPRAYEDGRLIEEAMTGIRLEPLDSVGAKVDETVTVVKSVWSQNYNVYFITAVTESRHAVFFSYRERLSNGHQCRVRGTVKAHRENSTQLNRVRIV
jgi:hypothetical protein